MASKSLRSGIEALLNNESAENESDTPDFILAEFFTGCLDAFDLAVNRREVFYGRPEKSLQRKVTADT